MARIYTFGAQWSTLPSADAIQTPIKTFQCPSAENPRFTVVNSPGSLVDGRKRATTDYAPLTGINPQLANLGIIRPRGTSTYGSRQ